MAEKTASQRLRAVLYIFWEQNKPTEDFEVFYQQKMDEIITHFKTKLV